MEKLRINFNITRQNAEGSYYGDEIISTVSVCESVDEMKAAQTAIWNLLWGVILATDPKATTE